MFSLHTYGFSRCVRRSTSVVRVKIMCTLSPVRKTFCARTFVEEVQSSTPLKTAQLLYSSKVANGEANPLNLPTPLLDVDTVEALMAVCDQWFLLYHSEQPLVENARPMLEEVTEQLAAGKIQGGE